MFFKKSLLYLFVFVALSLSLTIPPSFSSVGDEIKLAFITKRRAVKEGEGWPSPVNKSEETPEKLSTPPHSPESVDEKKDNRGQARELGGEKSESVGVKKTDSGSVSYSEEEIPSVKEDTEAEKGVNFYFDDADVFEVINVVFGEILKVNYIIDPKISGRVNFKTTTPVRKQDILPLMEIILRLNGIAVVEEQGLYRLIPLPDISKEPAPLRFGKKPYEVRGISVVQIVPIEYADSSDMVKILTPLLTKGGVIVDLPGTNYLMIADTDKNIQRLLQVVNIFDVKDAQEASKPHVYVYPLQNAEAKHVSELLQKIFLGAVKKSPPRSAGGKSLRHPPPGAKDSTPPVQKAVSITEEAALISPDTRIFADEITNSLVILSTARDYAVIEDVVRKLDVVPRQVLIEALVAEVTLKDEFKFGLEWYLRSHFNLDNTKLTGVTGFGESVAGFDPSSVLSQTGFTFAALDAAEAVRGLLQTLATDQKVKVIASPHIMVSDNREARIQVGDQLPVQTSQSETSAGTLVTSIQYRDTGSMLKVKPQINEGGLVSLDITQELSFETGTGVEGNPIISNRTAETHVVVQDGQTIVIGGLIRENNDSSRSGVPVLKDIPILGYLFGATETSVNRTELVVLITPHVVKSISDANKAIDRIRQKMKGLNLKEIMSPDAVKTEERSMEGPSSSIEEESNE